MKLIKIPKNKELYNEIPAALTDDNTISAGAKILWIKLFNSNRGEGKNITYNEFKPSTQVLATILGVEKSTIKITAVIPHVSVLVSTSLFLLDDISHPGFLILSQNFFS